MVSSKKISSKNFKFFELLQVRDHEIFKKLLGPYIQNTSLKLTETTQNVVRNVYLDFLGCFKKKKFSNNFKYFQLICRSGVIEFLKNDKVLNIHNTSLKLTETTRNVVRNVYLDFLDGFE